MYLEEDNGPAPCLHSMDGEADRSCLLTVDARDWQLSNPLLRSANYPSLIILTALPDDMYAIAQIIVQIFIHVVDLPSPFSTRIANKIVHLYLYFELALFPLNIKMDLQTL